jgi:hypothetical protein
MVEWDISEKNPWNLFRYTNIKQELWNL